MVKEKNEQCTSCRLVLGNGVCNGTTRLKTGTMIIQMMHHLHSLPEKQTDGIGAFQCFRYQPEILKRGEFLHAPKATSLSPSSRGIPTYSPKARGYFRVPEAHELELAGYPTQRGASPTHLLAPMKNLAVLGEQRSNETPDTKPAESPEKYSLKLPSAQSFTTSGPRRGKGLIQHPHEGSRVPFCKVCSRDIRGPFILAINDCFCPEHFVCSVDSCRKRMLDVGFVDVQGDGGRLCCENCYEKFFAPPCYHCSRPITKNV
uniref:LIM zinc-binding domain-containing protein n=1 Tax=Romanomermis culicivorax TaxID=13658 RepID=A0A915HGT3_ROMCU